MAALQMKGVPAMSEQKHTPGPWAYRIGQHHTDFILSNGSVIEVEWRIAEANARLIAAAPDLLEALRDLVEATSGGDMGMGTAIFFPREFDAARAAIAKAEGGEG